MKSNRKKFFQTDVGKVLKGAASLVAPKLVDILDGVESPEEALNIIRGSQDVSEDTKHQLIGLMLDHEKELTRRHESDNRQELWLPKLIRPLTLVTLTLAYVVGFFYEFDVSILHPPLMMVFGFYFGGRSLEKLLSKHV